MATFMEEYASNLTSVIDAIVASKLYTNIKAMYDDGTFQKDSYYEVVIAFNKEVLGMAGSLAEKAYRLDEIVAAELALKNKQIEVENARKALLEQQQRGFFDNRVLEWHKTNMEGVSMIQSGGNEAPQTLWDQLSASEAMMSKIAANHPENTVQL